MVKEQESDLKRLSTRHFQKVSKVHRGQKNWLTTEIIEKSHHLSGEGAGAR